MAARGNRAAPVVNEEVVQNVGSLGGIVSLEGAMPVVFTCNPGQDIMTKISLDCEVRNQTLISIINMGGIVMNPSLIYGNNQTQTHEGARTLMNMTLVNYPPGNNDGGCKISILGDDGIAYGGRVAGPLIAASQISGVLLVKPPVEDNDSGSCLTSD